MKKIFIILSLCCATVLFMTSCGGGSKSGSSEGTTEEASESSESKVDALCVTADENTVVLLTHPNSCTVENTDKGCLVTFKTKAGKQAFLMPCQYRLDEYDNCRANGSYEELKFIPGEPFKRDTGFSTKGCVRPFEGRGITFQLPNGKLLSFVAINFYEKDYVENATIRVRHLDLKLLSKQLMKVLNVNVSLALTPHQIIMPIYRPSSEQLSTPTDVQKLVSDGKIESCKLYNFD